MSNQSQYKTLREWCLSKPNDYLTACKLGVLKDISEHFGWDFKEKKYNCTIEELIPTTVGCESYSEWRKKERTFYRLACRHNLTDELCDKVGWAKRRENGYWTLERCIESAKNYKTVSEWAKKCSGSRSSAQDNGWMDECTEHMVYNNKPDGYWTRERCVEEAKKYTTRKEWRATSKGSWGAAMTLKCYKECTSHMKLIKSWKK